jgi:hypothetical protein
VCATRLGRALPLISVLFLGWLLVIWVVVQAVHAFWARQAGLATGQQPRHVTRLLLLTRHVITPPHFGLPL